MNEKAQKTVNIQIEDFVQFLTISSPVAENTVRLVVGRTRIILDYLNSEALPFTYSSIERFLFSLKTEKHLENNSINTYIFVIKNLCKYCEKRDIEIDKKLADLEMLPKNKPIIIPLAISEVERLLAVDIQYTGLFHGESCQRLNQVYKALIRFIVTTGCRYQEASGLQVKDVDFEKKYVRFTKTKGQEYTTAYIRGQVIDEMKELVANQPSDAFVFRNMVGKRIYPTDFGPDMRERAKRAGITKRVHPHILRHSYSVSLLDEGVGLEKVAQLLHHKDIRTTYENYAHLSDRTKERANDMHPLNRISIPAYDRLKSAIDQFRAHNFDQDNRFDNAVIEKHLALMYESIKS